MPETPEEAKTSEEPVTLEMPKPSIISEAQQEPAISITPELPEKLEPLITSEAPEAPSTPSTPSIPSTPSTPKTLSTSETPAVTEEREPCVPNHQQKRPPIWIPILGGAVVALVAFLFSNRRESEE